MKTKNKNTKHPGRQTVNDKKKNLPGYSTYPASEDIYSKYQEKKDVNPEDISKIKEPNDSYGISN